MDISDNAEGLYEDKFLLWWGKAGDRSPTGVRRGYFGRMRRQGAGGD